MKNHSKDNCDVTKCPMDCNFISYSYSIISTPFKEAEHCSNDGKDSIFDEFYKNPFPPRFMTRARTFFFNESSRPSDQCAKYLPYRAEVTFRLATDTVSVTVRTRRLSFFDKLSAFGNYSCVASRKHLLYCQVESWASSLGSVFSAWWRSLSGLSGSV